MRPNYIQIQKEKIARARREKSKRILKKVLTIIAITIGMLVVMGLAGRAYPH